MPVVLTQECEGLNVGDPYTGANEAWLLASGYAEPAAGADYTGPGAAPEGPADTTIANNREFDATRGNIAHDGGTPEAATNDGDLKLSAADAISWPATDAVFDGFANDPATFPTSVTEIQPDSGVAAGGTVLEISGTGLTGATGVTFGGTAGTAFSVVDSKNIAVTTPAKAAGTYDVVVLHPGGNKTITGGFTYTA